MKKKVISLIIIVGIIIGAIFSITTDAGTGKLYTNLASLNLNGIGFGIGNPTNKGKYIWHMTTYDSINGGISQKQKNIYCLKGDYGISWQEYYRESPILEYNMVFDLQKDREELSSKIVDNKNDADEVVQALLNENGTQYREILWLLDNLYINGETNKEDYLYRIGVKKDVYEGTINYYNYINGNDYGEEVLTGDEIIAIQRAAIWTITNGGDFDKTENTNWLMTTLDGATYSELNQYKDRMAVDLYKYLVNSAKNGAKLYTANNNYTISEAPVTVDTQGLTPTQTEGVYKINLETKSSDYIIGPIVINKNHDMLYNISMNLTDESGAEIPTENYSFTDSNGTSLKNFSLKDIAGNTEGFYIKLDSSLATRVNIEILVEHYKTTKNLWLQGTETTQQVLLNAEQPITEFSRTSVDSKIKLVAEPGLIDIPVTKVWVDSDNQDGIRPNSVTVQLLANGNEVEGKTLTLNETNNWRDTFTQLNEKINGETVVYTVVEKDVPSTYTSNVTGNTIKFTITNTHDVALKDIPVTKKWEDVNNQDGKRPNSVEIILYADGVEKERKQVTGTGDTWTTTFSNLPVKKAGKDITYTIDEVQVTGYVKTVNGFEITNKYVPQTKEIEITKIWDDENNQDGIRPNSVDIILYADGVEKERKQVTGTGNTWTTTFSNLPVKKAGKDITYSIDETQVSGYEKTVNGFEITNKYVPQTKEIEITKIWDDEDNQDGIRPSAVEIILYADGVEVDRKEVTGTGNAWTEKFTNLPVKKAGKEIIYTIDETEIEGYEKTINGFEITNKYIPKTTSIKIVKVWKDSNDKDGLRTDEVTVELLKNGSKFETIKLNDSNNWEYTLTGLPKIENGEDVTYTVEEITEIEGYTTTIEEKQVTAQTQYIITNFHEVPNAFDLALRKYITKLNGENLTETRVPNIDEDSLQESTTAIYKHRKEPVKVKTGDIVTYSITIYNEGRNGGYATQIIDQLPEGLKYISENTVTSDKNTYTVTYDETKNQVIFDLETTTQTEPTILQAYTSENLDSETIEIQCEVTAKASKDGDKVLTNVAWISAAYDVDAEKSITEIGDDRDSEPSTAPNVDKDNMEEYIGNVDNKTDLTDDTYHYEGEQDDDDFEKLVIPEQKIFDLALRKYIIEINNNELTTLGLSTRVPNISEATLQTSTTATYKHRKDPIEVEENDIVTYAITIYNEGEKAGYASQIIDQLPEGLIFNPSKTVASDRNTYKVTYETSTNKIILDIIDTEENPAKELKSYEDGKLDSETIEIKCKVIHRAKVGTKNILTNVAWINEAFDSEENKKITTTVGEDRDSEPRTKPNVNKDNMEQYKGNVSNKNDLSDNTYYYQGEQDDDDFEKIYVKIFDLNLRKFISSINGIEPEVSREPVVDITPLKNGTSTTAIYTHAKTPLALKVADTIVYTLRIYNEGEIDGYASEVKDYLPPYLDYVENSSINKKYGWKISEDGRLATTTYLADKEIQAFNGTGLDYEDIQIECKISENAIPEEKITNIAEISQYKYGDTVYPEDIDSASHNIDKNLPEDAQLPNYKNEQEASSYVPGYEDDDDFEKVYVKQFDLSLRKFITQVRDKKIESRVPQVKYENGKISYEHPKDALTVHVGDVIVYTIRVYNEGELEGYASKITDDIPEYLEYLPQDTTNVEYMWKMYDEKGIETENVEQAVKVKTEYLSKTNSTANLIKGFDGVNLSYKDIKIAFKVKDPNSNKHIITNCAQISDDTDDVGNQIKDKDSQTDKWNEGEDDQDVENIKVEYFDLSILKFVSKVIVQENGTEKITQTGYNGHENPEPIVKVELHKKKLKNVVVKFGYGITVTNEGDMPGYATQITDYVPEGLKFEPTDNPEWIDEGNNVISTRQLENVLLQPGESKTIEVILTWINSPDNMAQKTNTVEISEDKNEYNVPDRDSIINNKKNGEDDIDVANVLLVISTGRTQTYFMLSLGLLAVIAIGVALIKRYVI